MKPISALFRPPLTSDNLNDTLKLNRFLANPPVITGLLVGIDLFFFFVFNYCVNVFSRIPKLLTSAFTGENADVEQYLNIKALLPALDQHGELVRDLYWIFAGVILMWDIKAWYTIQVSFSDKAVNKGTYGTERWSTVSEVMRQYKEIPMRPSRAVWFIDGSRGRKTNWFKGRGGIPVMRWRNRMYIDSQKLTNCLLLGSTRSGKGEMYVYTMIDIFSRAKDQKLRPSMIIFDPKLELYKSSFATLQKREYRVRLINLDNPMKSAGYNPLDIVAKYYRAGNVDEAQQLAKSFAYAIFNSNKDTSEVIWKNTATDLFTAMIIAVTHDCIEMDATLNEKRVTRFNRLRAAFREYASSREASSEEIRKRTEKFAKVYLNCEDGEDYLDQDMILTYLDAGIPEHIPASIAQEIIGEKRQISVEYRPIYPNEKKVNCFSVLNFFKEMVDTVSVTVGQGQQAGEKKEDTALDDYFNARPPLDYAKALYSSIKSSGDRTKGSVYINMQSALSIFMQDSIARLTAESSIDIRDIGFDTEHPTAVFVGLPTEDKANHFLALNFITQVFQYLWKLSKHGTNTVDREVQFIFDEFGNMPIMDNFDGMVTNCLGAGMAFNIFIQSYNQLGKYELDEDTIKDNFANQVFIMQVGEDSSEEFSKQLGNKTVVEVQRSGGTFSLQKNITESEKERPLLNANELKHLREGEVAMMRVAKRTDNAGAAIRNYPILCEYQDNIRFWWKPVVFCRKVVYKRWIQNDRMTNKETGDPLTDLEEFRYWLSETMRWQGTAFLYRWQYMTEDFPNPTQINFFEVFSEKGREGIDYRNRVISVNQVKAALGIRVDDGSDSESPLNKAIGDMEKGTHARYVNWCSDYLGVDFRERLELTEKMTVADVWNKVFAYVADMDKKEKQTLIRDDFLGGLNRILSRE